MFNVQFSAAFSNTRRGIVLAAIMAAFLIGQNSLTLGFSCDIPPLSFVPPVVDHKRAPLVKGVGLLPQGTIS